MPPPRPGGPACHNGSRASRAARHEAAQPSRMPAACQQPAAIQRQNGLGGGAAHWAGPWHGHARALRALQAPCRGAARLSLKAWRGSGRAGPSGPSLRHCAALRPLQKDEAAQSGLAVASRAAGSLAPPSSRRGVAAIRGHSLTLADDSTRRAQPHHDRAARGSRPRVRGCGHVIGVDITRGAGRRGGAGKAVWPARPDRAGRDFPPRARFRAPTASVCCPRGAQMWPAAPVC